MTPAAGRRERRVLQSTAEAEAKLDALCATLLEDEVYSSSRVAEIFGWSAMDVRAAHRRHRSWTVAEYARRCGFTRQHVIALIHDGKILGAFRDGSSPLAAFRIPDNTPAIERQR